MDVVTPTRYDRSEEAALGSGRSFRSGRRRSSGVPAGSGERTGVLGPRRGRRRWRWLRRLVAALLVLTVLIVGGFGVLLEATPSVHDAPARVAAELADHHAPSDDGVIPAKVAAALLATEDSRFYSDPALDPQGVTRAAWGEVTADQSTGGATIEVQLAKLLYTPGRSGVGAEVQQVGLAVKLDHEFTKRRILAMYLDAAYFGDGAYGITAAAHHYFDRPAGQLSWAQASLLAGLVQAPTDYDPHGHLHLALLRRRHVLDRLVTTGALTRAQAQQIETAPLHPAVSFSG
jgi:membrane peptidoglycan carboxypeptidase